MYLFVYKTTHINGKYYIGRHQTENLNDGYLGSGKWIKSIKNKSTLSKEIIKEAKSFEELCELEEYYINLYWDDPLCMNYLKSSGGWTSEDVKQMVEKGTHPSQRRPDGTSHATDRVENGTHNLQRRPDGTSLQTDRVKNGTHHFLARPDGASHNTDRVNLGIHPFQTRPDGTSLQTDRVKNGTHHLLSRPDGTSVTSDRVKNGTHNFLGNKGYIACYNDKGEYKRIQKGQYYSQLGPMDNWEWVHMNSKEGKRRKLLSQNQIKSR